MNMFRCQKLDDLWDGKATCLLVSGTGCLLWRRRKLRKAAGTHSICFKAWSAQVPWPRFGTEGIAIHQWTKKVPPSFAIRSNQPRKAQCLQIHCRLWTVHSLVKWLIGQFPQLTMQSLWALLIDCHTVIQVYVGWFTGHESTNFFLFPTSSLRNIFSHWPNPTALAIIIRIIGHFDYAYCNHQLDPWPLDAAWPSSGPQCHGVSLRQEKDWSESADPTRSADGWSAVGSTG